MDRVLRLNFGAEAPQDVLCLQSDAKLYGLCHNRILKMAITALAEAIELSKTSRKLQSGFAVDSQGLFYPPMEKARDICRGFREVIQNDLKHYELDIDELSELCEMTYEKEETSASLAFFQSKDIPTDVESLIVLDDKVNDGPGGQKFYFDRTHLREIRKLLAGLTPGASLLFTKDQGKNAYICRGYALLKSVEPPIRVHLQGRKGATFYTGNTPWFRMCGTQILAPIDSHRIAQDEICRELTLPADQYEGFFQALGRQGKGTVAVFVDLKCEMVAKWYQALASYGRAWKIQKHPVTNLTDEEQEQICALSRIDGALIVDISEGTLVYVGAVLDALGITEGRRDRGARKNGVLAHVANLALLGGVKRSIAAAVYSEDGMVTSVLGSSYYGNRTAKLAGCMHPLIEKFKEN